jgi:hypothetical protein
LKITNKLFAAAALSLATFSGAAFAQAANVQAGATVYDPQGGTVGTVDSVTNGVAAGPEVARILRAVEARWIAEGFPERARVEALLSEEVGGKSAG